MDLEDVLYLIIFLFYFILITFIQVIKSKSFINLNHYIHLFLIKHLEIFIIALKFYQCFHKVLFLRIIHHLQYRIIYYIQF